MSEVVPPVAPAPPANTPWYQGNAAVTPEFIGHWQTRGWHDLPPDQLAINVTKAYREAEKFIGAPADELIRVPKDANDAAGWGKVWQRLGAPKDKDGYDFSTAKSQFGDVDKALIDGCR